MSLRDLTFELSQFKYKLIMHLEERGTDNANQGYIKFIEQNIAYIQRLLAKAKAIKEQEPTLTDAEVYDTVIKIDKAS